MGVCMRVCVFVRACVCHECNYDRCFKAVLFNVALKKGFNGILVNFLEKVKPFKRRHLRKK